MRKIVQVFVLIFVSNLVLNKGYAQVPKVLAFGNFTYAAPSNSEFKNIASSGTGYELGAGFGFGKTMFTISGGQITYSIPNNITVGGIVLSNQPDQYRVTPIKVGIRQYLLFGLFINGNVGMAIQKYDKYQANGDSFLWEFGAGYKFFIFEFGAAYTGNHMSGTNINANSLLLKGGLAIKI
jgi:hypothetical protein